MIGDWRPLERRGATEVGHLWENYLVAERAKWRLVHEPDTREFFWRTAQQQEVDLVEAGISKLRGFEFKWNAKNAKVKLPRTFTNAYPESVCHCVTRENVVEFLV